MREVRRQKTEDRIEKRAENKKKTEDKDGSEKTED